MMDNYSSILLLLLSQTIQVLTDSEPMLGTCSKSDVGCRKKFYKAGNGKNFYKDAKHYWPLDIFLDDVRGGSNGRVLQNGLKERYEYESSLQKSSLSIQNDYCVNLGNFQNKCLGEPLRCLHGNTIKFIAKIKKLSKYNSYIISSGCEEISHAQTAGFQLFWNGASFVAKACISTHLWRIPVKRYYIENKLVNITMTWTEKSFSLYVNNYLIGRENYPSSIFWYKKGNHDNFIIGCPNSQDVGYEIPNMDIADVVVYYNIKNPAGPLSSCQMQPLGMESRKIKDNSISASSSVIGFHFAPSQARLNNFPADSSRDGGAWTALQTDQNQWLQINFGKEVAMSAVSTQGHPIISRYVKTYAVGYMEKSGTWKMYKENSVQKVFDGNEDKNTVVLNYFQRPVYGTALRFYPLSWYGGISLRCEIYGCSTFPKIILNESKTTTKTAVTSSISVTTSSSYSQSTRFSSQIIQSSIDHKSIRSSYTQLFPSMLSTPLYVSYTQSINLSLDSTSSTPRIVSTKRIHSLAFSSSSSPVVRSSSIDVLPTLSTTALSLANRESDHIRSQSHSPSSYHASSLVNSSSPQTDTSTIIGKVEPTTMSELSSRVNTDRYSSIRLDTTSLMPTNSVLLHIPHSSVSKVLPREPSDVSQDLLDIQKEIEILESNPYNDKITNITASLITASNKTLTAMEIDLAITYLFQIVKIQQNATILERHEAEFFMEDVTSVASIILEERQRSSWGKVAKPLTRANQLIEILNTLAEAMHLSMRIGMEAIIGSDRMRVEQKSLEMEVSITSKSIFEEVHFQSNIHPGVFVKLPKDIANFTWDDITGFVAVNNMAFHTIGDILQPINKRQRLLNSIVVSSKVLNSFEDSIPLLNPAKMRFTHTNEILTGSDRLCSYLNTSSFGIPMMPIWWNQGCEVAIEEDNATTCACYHLTNFALIMDVHGSFEYISEKDRQVLSVISVVGSVITILCCIATLLSFSLTRNKSRTIFIHSNLIVSLTLVHVVFLLSIWDTVVSNEISCRGVAIALHFSLLVMFSWMIVEGLHIYSKLVKVFYSRNRRKIYIAIGWGLPIATMIFAISFASKRYGLGGKNSICWIEQEFIWIFVGPIGFVILMNIFVLVSVALVLVRRDRYKRRPKNDKLWEEKVRTVFKVTFMLLPLLGVSWIVGYFLINEYSLVLMYIFNILNGLQGMHIFIGYSVLDEDVRNGIASIFLRDKRKRKFSESRLQSNASAYGRNTMRLMQASRKWSTESLNQFFHTRSRSLSNSSGGKEKDLDRRVSSTSIHPITKETIYRLSVEENAYVISNLEVVQKDALDNVRNHCQEQKLSSVPEEIEDTLTAPDQNKEKDSTLSFRSNSESSGFYERPPVLRCNSWINDKDTEDEIDVKDV